MLEVNMEKETCIRCGKIISAYIPPLKVVAELNKVAAENLLETLIKLGAPSKEDAQDFLAHKYLYTRCEQTYPECPKCNHPLKTWHATMCIKCV